MCFVLGLLLSSWPRLAKQGIKRVSGYRWNDGIRLTLLFQQHSEITSEIEVWPCWYLSINTEKMKQETGNTVVDCSGLLLQGYKEILGCPTPSNKLKESGHNLSVSKNYRKHLLLLAQTTWAYCGHWLLLECSIPSVLRRGLWHLHS